MLSKMLPICSTIALKIKMSKARVITVRIEIVNIVTKDFGAFVLRQILSISGLIIDTTTKARIKGNITLSTYFKNRHTAKIVPNAARRIYAILLYFSTTSPLMIFILCKIKNIKHNV